MEFLWGSSIGWFALSASGIIAVYCLFLLRERKMIQTGNTGFAGSTLTGNPRSINEERLQLLQDATSDGIWDWDALTNEVYWSNNSFRMIGYEPDEFEINFDKWKSLVHPDDLPDCLRLIEESERTCQPLTM